MLVSHGGTWLFFSPLFHFYLLTKTTSYQSVTVNICILISRKYPSVAVPLELLFTAPSKWSPLRSARSRRRVQKWLCSSFERRKIIWRRKKHQTSGGKVYCGASQQHNELYFLPARAAVLLRHLSDDVKLIEFPNALNLGGKQASVLQMYGINYLFSANYAHGSDQSGWWEQPLMSARFVFFAPAQLIPACPCYPAGVTHHINFWRRGSIAAQCFQMDAFFVNIPFFDMSRTRRLVPKASSLALPLTSVAPVSEAQMEYRCCHTAKRFIGSMEMTRDSDAGSVFLRVAQTKKKKRKSELWQSDGAYCCQGPPGSSVFVCARGCVFVCVMGSDRVTGVRAQCDRDILNSPKTRSR